MTERRKADVLVVGSGAAGSIAALTAADRGASVTLVAGPPGATALSSGAIDLAGLDCGIDATVEQAFAALEHRAPLHPLILLGRSESLTLAVETAERLCGMGDLYRARPVTEPPGLAASGLGGLHRAWLLQRTQADLRAFVGASVGVADFGPACPFSAWLVKGGLEQELVEAGLELELEQVPVELPRELGEVSLLLAAGRLDRDDETKKRFAEALAASLSERKLSALLIPPLVGLDRSFELCRFLSEAAGAPVFELLGRPGDPPGMRLHRLLEHAIAAAGVEVIRGKAESCSLTGDHLDKLSVRTREGAIELEAGNFVLATGGLAGGGLRLARTLKETLLGLPLAVDGKRFAPPSSLFGADRDGYYGASSTGPHCIQRVGVQVDASLRPMAAGEPVLDNLLVAGAILADHDSAFDGSGLATAMITGAHAGRASFGEES